MMMKACPKVGCVWREYCLHSVDHNKLPHCDIESNFCPACKPVRQKPEKVKPKYRYKIVPAYLVDGEKKHHLICAKCRKQYGEHYGYNASCNQGDTTGKRGVFSKRVRVKVEPKYRYKIVLAGWPGVKTTTTTICAGCGVKYGLHDAFSLECPDGSGVFSKRVRVKIEPKQNKKGGSVAQNRYVIKQEPEPVKPKVVELYQADNGVDIKVGDKYVLAICNDGYVYRCAAASGTGLKTYPDGSVRIKGMRNC